MKKERLAYIDNIKCFAIVLVVLGHLIQYIYYPNTFDHNHVFRYIYSFHMPLFMAISGFIVGLSSQNKKINLLESILKRAKQLLIPFISWAIVSTIIGKNINKFFSIIKNPDNGLWFLWVLFFIYLAYLITLSLKNLFNLKFIQVNISVH